MGRDEFLRKLPSSIGVLRAGGVVPDEVIEHYMSWGSVQYGEAGDSLDGTILLVSGRWLYKYEVKWSGGVEVAAQRVVPVASLQHVTRTWRGSHGFDEGDATERADEYAAILQFEGEEPIELPLRETDYGNPPQAWRRAQALIDAILQGS